MSLFRMRHVGAAVGLGLALVLAGCGGGEDDAFDSGGGETAAAGGGELVVGGANFTEMLVMQAMYQALLEDAGYTVTTQAVDSRELYYDAVKSGDIDVVPEYAATLAEFVNRAANGADAPPVASADVDATVSALRGLLGDQGVEVLEPAAAVSQNAFAVTTDFAAQNSLTTLSDLGALGQPLVLAATEECPDRPFCQPGLEQTYGLSIAQVLPLGFGTLATKQAVVDGDAQLGLVGSTDGSLDQLGLVALEDDKGLQNADNLIPLVTTDAAGDQALVDALNSLAPVLTTEDLAALNAEVDGERKRPEEVATAYLEEKGLLGG